MRDAGHPDLGPPGPRPEYTPTYYGAFIADPAGNSIEAVHKQPPRTDGTTIDHLWLRVHDLDASTRFYEADRPDRRLPGQDTTRAHHDLPRGRRHLLACPRRPNREPPPRLQRPRQETVDAFHHAGIQAGYTSLGEPGERPQYHPGYYAAYLQDPDHHNIEAVHHDRL